ncbi:MAG: hypothetical protein RQ722_09325 [Desulfuromonadales bacterium]|nr:hypothetical protein [Desulfuromonadales bacterium]
MPRIFDNISNKLLSTLRATLATASHSGFCVGYFINYDIKYRMGWKGEEVNTDD